MRQVFQRPGGRGSPLVERSVIQYTDLQAARAKLDQLAIARAEIEGLSNLLGDGLD